MQGFVVNSGDRAGFGSKLRRLLVIGLASAALAGCGSIGIDGFEDDDLAGKDVAPDTALIGKIMTGLGAVDGSREPIAHRPRSPLVVPPSRTLPTPESKVARPAPDGTWPVNPESRDLAALKKLRSDPDKTRILDEPERISGKVWTPAELAAYRTPGGGTKGLAKESKTLRDTEDGRRLTEKEMKETISVDKTKTGRRRRLTDPPVAYRKPASTAPMPESTAVAEPSKKTVMDRAVGGYRHYN